MGKTKLLDHAVAFTQHARLQQQSRRRIGPEFVPVAHAVLRFEHQRLRVETADALGFAFADFIIFGQGRQLVGEQCGERAACDALVAAHYLGIRVIAEDFVVVADDFAARAVEGFQLFVFVAIVDEMNDPGGFDLVAVLVDEGSGVVQITRCIGNFLQQRQRFRLLQRIGGGDSPRKAKRKQRRQP